MELGLGRGLSQSASVGAAGHRRGRGYQADAAVASGRGGQARLRPHHTHHGHPLLELLA